MKNLIELTAEEILNIRNPSEVFTKENFVDLGRKASHRWHPDKNKSSLANAVFAHIRKLIEHFEHLPSMAVTFETAEKQYNFRYVCWQSFDLGKMYVSQNYLLFHINDGNDDLIENFTRNLALTTRENQFKQYAPVVKLNVKSNIGHIIVLENKGNLIRLSDLVKHKALPPVHVAWILNSLYNYALFVNKLCKHSLIGITPDNVFVDVKNHLATPWTSLFYSAKHQDKLIAAPQSIISLLNGRYLKDKKALEEIDRFAIKMLGVFCLNGHDYSSTVLREKNVPDKMIAFLFDTAFRKGETLLADYEKWYDTLTAVFGPRKFVKLDIAFEEIYLSLI